MKKDKFDVINAAEKMDWQQVIFNGGPPCFHMDAANGGFCGRAERWPGHGRSGMIHKFVSLANLFRNSKTEIYLAIDMESGNIHRRLKPETVAALPYSYSVENLQPIIFCQRRVISRFLPVNQSFSLFYQAHWTPVKHRLDPFTVTNDFSTQNHAGRPRIRIPGFVRQVLPFGGIFVLPVLIQRIRDFCQPRPIFDLFQQFRRRKILDAMRWWIAQRLEQTRSHQDRHIMRLAVNDPRRLLRRQAGWQLVQQPQKLMLLLSHSSLNCLNTGCRWPSRLTPHQVFSFVTYLAQ